jgi:hypothetical protein
MKKRKEREYAGLCLTLLGFLAVSMLTHKYPRPLTRTPQQKTAGTTLELTPAGSAISIRSAALDAVFDTKPETLYMVDRSTAQLRKVNWKTGEKSNWTSLLSPACPRADLGPLVPLFHTRHLLLLNCGRVELRESDALAKPTILAGDAERPAMDYALSPDQGLLAVALIQKGSGDTYVRLIDTTDWAMVSQWPARVTSLKFSPAGDLLVSTFARNIENSSLFAGECGMSFFEVPSGKVAFEWSRKINGDICPQSPFFFVDKRPDSIAANESANGAIAIWSSRDGKLLRRLSDQDGEWGPAPSLESFAISRDGRLIAVCRSWPAEDSSLTENRLEIWDLVTGKEVYKTGRSTEPSTTVMVNFSQTEDKIVFVSSNSVYIFDYRLLEMN